MQDTLISSLKQSVEVLLRGLKPGKVALNDDFDITRSIDPNVIATAARIVERLKPGVRCVRNSSTSITWEFGEFKRTDFQDDPMLYHDDIGNRVVAKFRE